MGGIEEQPGKEERRAPLGEACLSEKGEPNGCQNGVKPSPNRARWQSLLGCRTVGSSSGSLLGLARCERAAQISRDDHARAVHGTGGQARDRGRQRGPARPAPPHVGNTAVACTPVDAADDSNPRHEQGRGTDDEGMPEHAHLARLGGGAALPLTLFPQGTGATTADAGRIDHAQAPVGFSAPSVAQQALGQPDSAACHPLEGQSLDPRSGQLSRARPRLPAHTLGREKASQSPLCAQAGEREQTRGCAPDQAQADVLTPGASFHTHWLMICQASCPLAA
jgi:hypothetical protein